MANKIKIKRGTTKTPILETGEIAINLNSKVLSIGNNNNNINFYDSLEVDRKIDEIKKDINDDIKTLLNKSAFVNQKFIRSKVDYLPNGKSSFGVQGMCKTKNGYIYCVCSGDKSVNPMNNWLIEIDFKGTFLRKVQVGGGHINGMCFVESQNAIYVTYMLSDQIMYLYKLDYTGLNVVATSNIICCSIGHDEENQRLIVFNDNFDYYFCNYDLSIIKSGTVPNTSGLKAYQGGTVYKNYYLALGFGVIYVMDKNTMTLLGNIQLPNYDVQSIHINEWEDLDIDENGKLIIFGALSSNTIDITNIGIGQTPTYNYYYVAVPYWGYLSSLESPLENGMKEGLINTSDSSDYNNAYKQIGLSDIPFRSLIVGSHSRIKNINIQMKYVEDGDTFESENQWVRGTISYNNNFLLKNCYSTDYLILNPNGACVMFDATRLNTRITKLTNNYAIYSKSNGENMIFSNGGYKANVYVKSSYDTLSNVCCVTDSINSGVKKFICYYDVFKHDSGYRIPFPRDYTHGNAHNITIKWIKSGVTKMKNYYFDRDEGSKAYYLSENGDILTLTWKNGFITISENVVESGSYPELIIYN